MFSVISGDKAIWINDFIVSADEPDKWLSIKSVFSNKNPLNLKYIWNWNDQHFFVLLHSRNINSAQRWYLFMGIYVSYCTNDMDSWGETRARMSHKIGILRKRSGCWAKLSFQSNKLEIASGRSLKLNWISRWKLISNWWINHSEKNWWNIAWSVQFEWQLNYDDQ